MFKKFSLFILESSLKLDQNTALKKTSYDKKKIPFGTLNM